MEHSERIELLRENLDLTIPEEVFSSFDSLHQCMGDITYFWDGSIEGFQECKYAILGFPQDMAITGMRGKRGARDGPFSFRQAFYKLSNYFEKPKGLLMDLGNIKIDLDADLSSIHKRMIPVMKVLLEMDIYPIVLGGGNDVTYASIMGIKETGSFEKLGLVAFDAHLNLHEVQDRFISASTITKINQDFPELVGLNNMVFFGARKETVSPHYAKMVQDKGLNVFYKDRITNLKNELLQGLNNACFNSCGIVVSFDMDSCDAGMMPGTSFPIPGGFTPDEVIEIAKILSKYKMSIYLDIINLNPEVDHNDITSVMASLFLFHFLEKK